MLRMRMCGWLFVLVFVSCEALNGPDDEPRIYTAADGFNGDYEGTWTGGQSDRSAGTMTGQIRLTISNNSTVTGDLAPISGSVRAVNGTVSAAGVIAASAASGTNGCVVRFDGQVTTSPAGATVNATGSGSYTLVHSPTCNTNTGTWSVTRR